MFIEARCPRCGRDYKLATHLRGKTVKCKECQAPFPVVDRTAGIQVGPAVPVLPLADSGAAGDEQRRRRYEPEVGLRLPELRKSKGGLLRVALLGGVGVPLLVVLPGVCTFLLLREKPSAAVPPTTWVAVHVLPEPIPQDRPPLPAPVNDPPPPEPAPRDPAPEPAAPPVPAILAPERVAWKAQPDPGPDLSRLTVKPETPFPLAGHCQVVFPATPSPFVAVRYGLMVLPTWEVIDLDRFQSVASYTGKLDLHDPVLSPNGKLLAGKGTPHLEADSITILSVADKRVVRTITLETRATFLHRMDFLDNSRLLTLKGQGVASVCEVFDVSSGRRLKQFAIPDLLVRPKNSLALSAGGKYLAVAHDNQVDLYHTGEGQLVGRLSLPGAHAVFEGLAFSPDGKELACLLQDLDTPARLVTWKMTTGAVAVQHSFANDVKSLAPDAFSYTGEVVQWAPDGSGWLLYGAVLIDRGSGAVLYQVPHDPGDLRGLPRRLVGKDQLVLASPNGADYQLTAIALPAGERAEGHKVSAHTDQRAHVTTYQLPVRHQRHLQRLPEVSPLGPKE